MSSDINQCNFTGRLGKDVEERFQQSGDAVASFSIAVESQWKNKQGEKQKSVEWVNVTAFGKLAEICAKYLVKGKEVYISGRMKTEKYTDKQGVERYATKIIADQMKMFGDARGNVEKEAKEPSDPKAAADEFVDDIPFN